MPFIVPSQLLTSYKFCFTERAAKSIIIDFCFIINSLRMVYNFLLYLKFPWTIHSFIGTSRERVVPLVFFANFDR